MRIIDEAKASEYLVSRAAYIIEDKIWIAPNNSNSIIECSLKSKTAENIYGIDEPAKEYMFSRIVKINNELYFIPAESPGKKARVYEKSSSQPQEAPILRFKSSFST